MEKKPTQTERKTGREQRLTTVRMPSRKKQRQRLAENASNA